MPTAVETPGLTALTALLAELDEQNFGQNTKAAITTLPPDQYLGEVLSQDVLDLVPAVQDSNAVVSGNLQDISLSNPSTHPGAVADFVLAAVPPAISGLELGQPTDVPAGPPDVTPPTEPPGAAISSDVLTLVGAPDFGTSDVASNHGQLQLGATDLPETPLSPIEPGSVADFVLAAVPPAIPGLETGQPTDVPAGPPNVTPPTEPSGAAISSEVLTMIDASDFGASAFVHTGLSPDAHGSA